jgi:virginiamycin B lyase
MRWSALAAAVLAGVVTGCSAAPEVTPSATDAGATATPSSTGAPAVATSTATSPAGASPAATQPPPTVPATSPTAAVLTTPEASETPSALPTTSARPTAPPASAYTLQEFDVPAGSGPHDVAPAPDGTVWYTAQRSGRLGRLDPETGDVEEVPLGRGSAPHGVIVGPDGAAWVTDGGLNAIVRVDPGTLEVARYDLPGSGNDNLNTATFDGAGQLWFTGQGGVYGTLDPSSGDMWVYDAPRGRGPYGIATTPDGEVWYVSLAGGYLARIDSETGEAEVFEPPTPAQGARRVWSDSRGRLWISEWNAGQVGMYDPATEEWREWRLPADDPQAYSIYVDELDLVWLTDFGSNSIVRFDPATESFDTFAIPTSGAAIRQQLGREGEVWGAESGTDKLVVLRLEGPGRD